MLDKNLALLPGSAELNGTSHGNGSSVDMGVDVAPKTYLVNVPSVSGTNPTLDVKIQESDNGSTWRDFLVFPQITAVGEYFVTGQSNARYRRCVTAVGGTDTPKFGNAIIAPVPAGRHTNF